MDTLWSADLSKGFDWELILMSFEFVTSWKRETEILFKRPQMYLPSNIQCLLVKYRIGLLNTPSPKLFWAKTINSYSLPGLR